MEIITKHSQKQTIEAATLLWSLASAQYPKRNQLLLNYATARIIQTLDVFALNARRLIENMPKGQAIALNSSRWQWEPSTNKPLVNNLWDALNHISHAKVLKVGFEELPPSVSVIDGGAVVIPYILAKTDRKELAYIDPFAMAHAIFYQALPKIQAG